MSEAVEVEVEKKMSKVGAIRQAIAEMGAHAHSTEICERAAELCGANIDISFKRNVYQVRSNINTGRDNTAKSVKAPKKASAFKDKVIMTPKAIAPKAHKNSSEEDGLTAFFTLWEAAKAFGTKEQAIGAINRLPAF
jgi:hypothetical protein